MKRIFLAVVACVIFSLFLGCSSDKLTLEEEMAALENYEKIKKLTGGTGVEKTSLFIIYDKEKCWVWHVDFRTSFEHSSPNLGVNAICYRVGWDGGG